MDLETAISASILGVLLKRDEHGEFCLGKSIDSKSESMLEALPLFARAKERGIRVLTVTDPLFQWIFRDVEEAPPLLFYEGNLNALCKHTVAVVGARKMTVDTLEWIENTLAKAIAPVAEISLASGGAIGTDQAVHRMAVEHGRPTIVWLPSGLLSVYPRSLERLRKTILERGGILLSPFWLKSEVRRHHFHMRNRWMVSHSNAAIVAQAEMRSGSHMTGNHALKVGRRLGVVLSHPRCINFYASYQLYEDGGRVLYDTASVKQFITESLDIEL